MPSQDTGAWGSCVVYVEQNERIKRVGSEAIIVAGLTSWNTASLGDLPSETPPARSYCERPVVYLVTPGSSD